MMQIRRIDYDSEYDILYLSFADQSDSYGDEISDNVVVRRKWADDSITGITIFDFMALFKAKSEEIFSLPVELNYEKQVLPYLQTA